MVCFEIFVKSEMHCLLKLKLHPVFAQNESQSDVVVDQNLSYCVTTLVNSSLLQVQTYNVSQNILFPCVFFLLCLKHATLLHDKVLTKQGICKLFVSQRTAKLIMEAQICNGLKCFLLKENSFDKG